jgi:hypothetical protein
MRFSSLVSLLVVTASFALGGCAADAEQTGETTGTGEAALVGSPRANTDTSVETARVAANANTKVTNEAPIALVGDIDHRANPGLQGATVQGLSSYRATHTAPGLQGAGVEIDGNRATIDPLGKVAATEVALANTNPAVTAGLPGEGSDTLDTSGSGPSHARRAP